MHLRLREIPDGRAPVADRRFDERVEFGFFDDDSQRRTVLRWNTGLPRPRFPLFILIGECHYIELQPSRARNRLLLFLAAFLFSTGGVAIKSCDLSAWQIAGFRSGIAALAIAIAMPEARRNWTWRTFAVGAAYAATLIAFVTANKLTTSANAIFLQATAPLYLLLLGPLILREKIRGSDIAVFAAIATGVSLLLYGSRAPQRGAGISLGDGIAIFYVFSWAWTLTGLRWLGKHDLKGNAATATVIAGNLIAFLVCLIPICLPGMQPAESVSIKDAAVVLYLGIFQVALAYVFLTRSIRHIPRFGGRYTFARRDPCSTTVVDLAAAGAANALPLLCWQEAR